MRLQLCLAGALALLLPASSFAAPEVPDGVSLPDVPVQSAKAGEKGKASKKSKKNAEPETPPPPPPDTDEDGVIDANDKCVDVAEDLDGFEDADGCPDEDNDGDGVADADDGCPLEAENVDGWDDEDGCPEAAPTMAPMKFEATLMDGTEIEGVLVRIVAVDEDEKESKPFEPSKLGVIVNDAAEFETDWSNVRSLSSEKVTFSDSVDCYSEGIQELGDSPTWECTLKHPTVVKLASSEHKGTHRVLDRQMHRLDFKIADISCEGASCDAVNAQRGVSWYLYKLVAFEKSEEESEAMFKLQTRLKEMQKLQVKKASFEPEE